MEFIMVRRLFAVALLFTTLAVSLGTPALSQSQNGCDNSQGQPQGCGNGVPGPLAGVGIPFLIGGYVVYRRRRKSQSGAE